MEESSKDMTLLIPQSSNQIEKRKIPIQRSLRNRQMWPGILVKVNTDINDNFYGGGWNKEIILSKSAIIYSEVYSSAEGNLYFNLMWHTVWYPCPLCKPTSITSMLFQIYAHSAWCISRFWVTDYDPSLNLEEWTRSSYWSNRRSPLSLSTCISWLITVLSWEQFPLPSR